MEERTTSKSGEAKVLRAINQLENVERLLAGLPKKMYKPNKEFVEQSRRDVERLIENITRNLAVPDQM